jgi:hypothetical protein
MNEALSHVSGETEGVYGYYKHDVASRDVVAFHCLEFEGKTRFSVRTPRCCASRIHCPPQMIHYKARDGLYFTLTSYCLTFELGTFNGANLISFLKATKKSDRQIPQCLISIYRVFAGLCYEVAASPFPSRPDGFVTQVKLGRHGALCMKSPSPDRTQNQRTGLS